MERYAKYYGLIILLVAILGSTLGSYMLLKPLCEDLNTKNLEVASATSQYEKLKEDLRRVKTKIEKINTSISSSQKSDTVLPIFKSACLNASADPIASGSGPLCEKIAIFFDFFNNLTIVCIILPLMSI